MMITGYDNVIFSNRHPEFALRLFTKYLKNRWKSFLDEDEWNNIVTNCLATQSKIDFFFCKNNKMMSFHDRNGYSIDKSGEGCFYLIINYAKSFNAEITINKEIENSIGDFDRDPYDATIVLNDNYEYTLVTPENPAKNDFCKFILSSLIKALTTSVAEH